MNQQQEKAVHFMLVSCFAYYATLKMTATYCSETSVDFQQTMWRYITEDKLILKIISKVHESVIRNVKLNRQGAKINMNKCLIIGQIKLTT
jgi:hypothetical protein